MTSADGRITEAMVEAALVYYLQNYTTTNLDYTRTIIRRVLQAALAAQKGEGVREGWRLIKTAPKDQIILTKGGGVPLALCIWDTVAKAWSIPSLVTGTVNYVMHRDEQPTHWAPATPASWNEAVEACAKAMRNMKIRTADADAGNGYRYNETLNEAIKTIRALTRPDHASKEKPPTYIPTATSIGLRQIAKDANLTKEQRHLVNSAIYWLERSYNE